ncbi:MAG: lipopolysaccharide biosynthesis protein [archaeon]|nr:lipopolysaccharide biosynthesis protein [archaeon]
MTENTTPAENSSEQKFNSKVSINMLTNIVRTLLMALFGFLMVPYYIDSLGLAAYAIIPLATSIVAYILAVTDSLGDAFARFIAVSIQHGEFDEANRNYSTASIGLLRIILMATPICILVSILSPYIFQVGDTAFFEVQTFFVMVLLSSLAMSYSAGMDSVFVGYNRLYATYISKTVYIVLQVGIVLAWFFLFGPSLWSIGMSYVVATTVMLVMMFLWKRRICPDIRLSRRSYSPEHMKDMGALGLWTTVSELGILMFIQASLVLSNIYLGAESQGEFSIVANMISMINTATTSITVVFVPLAYRKYAEEDYEGLVKVVNLFTKFVGLVMVFPIAFILVFMEQIIGLWLGDGYEAIYDLLMVMLPVQVAVTTVRVLMNVPLVYLKMETVAKITLVIGLFNVAITFLSLNFTDLGLIGISMCWVISMLMIKVGFYPIYAARITGQKLRCYYIPLVYSHVLFLVTVTIMYVLNMYFTMPMSWLAVLSSFFIGFMVYVVASLKVMFDKEEKTMILDYFPGFVKRYIGRYLGVD